MPKFRKRIRELRAKVFDLRGELDEARKAQACAEDSASYEASRAARLREVLDAVREGCDTEGCVMTTNPAGSPVGLFCTPQGLRALADILRGEVGERDAPEEKGVI